MRFGVEPVPGYRLVRRRGRGGFGEVWEAEAPGGTRVALKFVHGTLRARAAELRALDFIKGIRHPNLLANFASWQVRGTLVVGMELADGSLWDRYVRAADEGVSGIPRAELLGYMVDSAAALDYLNQPRHVVDGRAGVGIQHRDVKPPNILLFGRGAKLADLGMARALEGDQAGHTGTWTFPYAAPEYFKRRTHRHSDQYGLAVTYCQLRSGRLPFEGGAALVTAGHLHGQPDLEGLPEPERPIVGRALAKEPGDRWPDCRSFVEALRALSGDEAPETLPRPAEPAEDVPRALRSSSGGGAAPHGFLGDFEDTPYSSWRDFESGGNPDPLPHADPPSEAATVIPPDPQAEAEPGAPPATGRLRFVRSAATILSIGLVIAASGVPPSGDRGQPSPLDARPVATPNAAEVVATIADPGPPAGPDVVSPIEHRPAFVEAEPVPAKAAEVIGLRPADPIPRVARG